MSEIPEAIGHAHYVWSTPSPIGHHRPGIMYSSVDAIFGNRIVMVVTEATVFYALTLGDKFIVKLFISVDEIFGKILVDGNANVCSLMLELELGLDIFSDVNTDLMNDGNFTASCVTEQSTTLVFFGGQGMTPSRKVENL